MAKHSAESKTESPHAHWDKLVSAAYLRMLGATQADAATAVGRNARTIRMWEADSELWANARAEARTRWLTDLTDKARRRLLDSMEKPENGDLALKVLERMDDALLPAKQRAEVAGEGGGPLEILVTRQVVRPSGDS